MKDTIWPTGGHFESDISENNRLWPIATNNMHMELKFHSKLELRSGNNATYRVQI